MTRTNSHNQKLLESAIKFALTNRPPTGGFPFLAACLKKVGVTKNIWYLPSAQSTYLISGETLIQQGQPILQGLLPVQKFNQTLLQKAIKTDQKGQSTFPEFLLSAWNAGVIRYEVDFLTHTVTYYGANNEHYSEDYKAVTIEDFQLN